MAMRALLVTFALANMAETEQEVRESGGGVLAGDKTPLATWVCLISDCFRSCTYQTPHRIPRNMGKE